jgi:hydrogenase maturation protein HypF
MFLRDSIYGIKEVVLSGGVFQNSYLLEGLYKKLMDDGYRVYINELVPTNDSGISVGQAAVVQSIVESEKVND